MNFFKNIRLNKLTTKVANEISTMFQMLVPDMNNPSMANLYDITIYKHQLKFLKYLLTYNKIFLLKSKHIGGTTTLILYLLYLCKTQKNQNIFIHSSDLRAVKKTLLSLLSTSNQIELSSVGIDFIEDNSHITFIEDEEIKKYNQQLSQFNDAIFVFDDFNESQLLLYDLLPIFKSDNKIIVISNSPLNSNGSAIWEDKIDIKFQTLLLSAFKIKFKRSSKKIQPQVIKPKTK